MITEPDLYLSAAAISGLVAILGIAHVYKLGRGGAAQLKVVLVRVLYFLIVLVLDATALIVTAAVVRLEWKKSFVFAPSFDSPEARTFWVVLTTFIMVLVPLVLAIFGLGLSLTRRRVR